VFTSLAAYGVEQLKLGGDNVEQIWGEVVSGNYFDVLGVAAQKGRTFYAEEDLVPGRNPVTVISHALWQRRFNSDPEIVGKTVKRRKSIRLRLYGMSRVRTWMRSVPPAVAGGSTSQLTT
jgi:hypothetical protein